MAGENVAPELLGEVSALGHPPRVIGVYRRDALPRGVRQTTLALWRVADPGNVGTLNRNAGERPFGAGIALSPGCADLTGPKAIRASMGAVFRVPTAPLDEAPEPWIALVPRAAMSLAELDLSGPATFVLGAERDGLPEEVLLRCETRATIPQSGPAESLNVAAAGAISLYEASRSA